MILETLAGEFSIARLQDFSQVNLAADCFFLARTDDEFSLVCRTEALPPDLLRVEHHWRAFRVAGQLDFSLVGILAKITGVLAAEQIGLFAVSTFNTDYILVKAENWQKALAALKRADYPIQPLDSAAHDTP